jgi:SnoaL-like domain
VSSNLYDELEIRNLSHRYAQALDRGDTATWRSLFTADVMRQTGDKPPSSYDQIARSPEMQLRRYQRRGTASSPKSFKSTATMPRERFTAWHATFGQRLTIHLVICRSRCPTT